MKYLELIEKYENYTKIPYEDLLNTTEWKEKRNNILQRDNDCCSHCGSTESKHDLNFNISFQTKDRLIPDSVVYQNKSLDKVKIELEFTNLNIYSDKKGRYFGLNKNGVLFLVNWEKFQSIPELEIVINTGITEMGRNFLILGKKNERYIDYTFSIPYITEKPVLMHVHHKFYIKDTLPWEYDNDALLTLCNWCHWELHEQTKIPIYTLLDGKLLELNYTPCTRCNGAGVLPEYKHVQNGVCFRCHGNKYEELINSLLIL